VFVGAYLTTNWIGATGGDHTLSAKDEKYPENRKELLWQKQANLADWQITGSS
jgi:hypothetical protein